MPHPSTTDEHGDGLDGPPAPSGSCELCGNPGKPVRAKQTGPAQTGTTGQAGLEQTGVIVLCEACLGRRLRRRLPWRRYLGLVGIGLFTVPVVGLVVGTLAEVAQYVRSGSVPPTSRTVGTVRHGLELLTTAGDAWGSLGVITAIAIALPVSLVTIASQGEQIARRAETEPVPDLEDYARLTLLDGALTFSKAIAHLTATLAVLLAVGAFLDGGPGWAQQTVLCLVLAAILVLEIGKLDAFPRFADRSRLLVATAMAHGVAARRALGEEVSRGRAAVALVTALGLHLVAYLAVTIPAGWGALSSSLNVVVVGAVGIAVLAALAALYLRDGDRPSLAMTMFVGLFVGVFWVFIIDTVADDMPRHVVNSWAVLLGAWSYPPLYLFITLGLIGTGPLRWLVRYTTHTAHAITRLDDAARARTHRHLNPDHGPREDGAARSSTASRPTARPGSRSTSRPVQHEQEQPSPAHGSTDDPQPSDATGDQRIQTGSDVSHEAPAQDPDAGPGIDHASDEPPEPPRHDEQHPPVTPPGLGSDS
ncbi:hypothetical protein ACO229_06705 [Promicromonospora sp. MS192]|uniref:hypothetical protein n=1 Tax=Promicromonospora sp. MS192 TaxID=3412684 RepID=UPI003C2E286D